MNAIKSFLKKVSRDDLLCIKMNELADTHAGVGALIKLAKENGFSFSVADWEAYIQRYADDRELADSDLVAVAGGQQIAPQAPGTDGGDDMENILRRLSKMG